MYEPIKVKWSMPSPPVIPRTNYTWPHKLSLDPEPLDSILGWPPGTMGALKEAFKENLNRFVAWNTEGHPQKSALDCAAQFYKRGVASSSSLRKDLEGAYEIGFFNGNFNPEDKCCIVDQNVAKLWSWKLGRSSLALSLDETTKTLETVGIISEFLEESSPKGPVYLVGGGVLCDTAAFACALKKIPFILVPSTLLSMADACIGGKTGVNFPPYGKNQVGLFAFPEEVLIYPSWLETLDYRQLRAGASECIKHALLDKSLFEILNKLEGPDLLSQHLPEIIAIKSKVVSQDPAEQGLRATLNLGHTLAHALEGISHSRGDGILLHGEAVSLGILMALYLSHHMNFLDKPSFQTSIDFLEKFKILPQAELVMKTLGAKNLKSDILLEEIFQYVLKDKKMNAKESQWILLDDIGSIAKNNERGFTISVEQDAFKKAYLNMIDGYLRSFKI